MFTLRCFIDLSVHHCVGRSWVRFVVESYQSFEVFPMLLCLHSTERAGSSVSGYRDGNKSPANPIWKDSTKWKKSLRAASNYGQPTYLWTITHRQISLPRCFDLETPVLGNSYCSPDRQVLVLQGWEKAHVAKLSKLVAWLNSSVSILLHSCLVVFMPS